MDFRKLLNKMDLLESLILAEDLRLKNIITQIAGQEGNDKERFAKLRQLANDEKLPGLYDPVTGKYITVSGGVSDTAPKEDDKRLAYMGLIPDNAATSTFWGRVFGTSGKDYDAELRTQSKTAIAAQDRAELEQEELAELKRLMPKYKELKLKTAKARRKQSTQSNSNQGGRPATEKNPDKYDVRKFVTPDGHAYEYREYGDGTIYLYDPARAKDYVHSVGGQPGVISVGTTWSPPKLPPGAKEIKESVEFKSNLAAMLIGSYKVEKLNEEFDLSPDMVEALSVILFGGATTAKISKNPALLKKVAGTIFSPLPGMATGYAVYDTYSRAKKGDWVGAGIAGLSGCVAFVPYVGWIGSLALDVHNVRRDISNEEARIKVLQAILGVPSTGEIDKKTLDALIAFQNKNKLKPTGELDDATAKFLNIPNQIIKETISQNTNDDLISLIKKYPPIFFYKDGKSYILLPNNGLFDEEGNQLNYKNLEIVASGVLTNLSSTQDISEEGAAVPIAKGLGFWEPIAKFLKSFKGSAAAKEAEGVATVITGNVTKQAGDLVSHQGKEYVWVGNYWAEKLPNGAIKQASEATQQSIERDIKSKALGIRRNDQVSAQARKERGEKLEKDGENVVRTDPEKAAADAKAAEKAAAEKAAAEKAAAEKAAAEKAAAEKKAAEKVKTGETPPKAGETPPKAGETPPKAGEIVPEPVHVPGGDVVKPSIWTKTKDLWNNSSVGKWLGLGVLGGVLIYGNLEYRKWKEAHPKDPDPAGTQYPDKPGYEADGNGGLRPIGGGDNTTNGPNSNTTTNGPNSNTTTNGPNSNTTTNGPNSNTTTNGPTTNGPNSTQAGREEQLTPDEENDLEAFNKIAKRVNDLIDDLSKTTNPAIRKELYIIKDDL